MIRLEFAQIIDDSLRAHSLRGTCFPCKHSHAHSNMTISSLSQRMNNHLVFLASSRFPSYNLTIDSTASFNVLVL